MAECFIYGQSSKTSSSASFTYGENIFDYAEFKESIGNNINNGTVEWNDAGFTLIASANDCYTQHMSSPKYPLNSGTTYELSFDASFNNDADDKRGRILVVYNGNTNTMFDRTIYQKTRFLFTSFTSTSNSEYIQIRFGVRIQGVACTYSNIQLREVLSIGD